MALISIHTNPSRRELRQFAAIWFPAFWLVIGWLVWQAASSLEVAATIWSLAVLVSVIGLLVPGWMRYVFIAWMWAAYPIGWLVAHLLLAVIYYLVLTPIGLALRAMGRDPLKRNWEPGCPSYWLPRNSDEDIARYFRQY